MAYPFNHQPDDGSVSLLGMIIFCTKAPMLTHIILLHTFQSSLTCD